MRFTFFLKQRDNTSGKKHGDDRSQSDADNMAAENQTDQTGNADAEEIKTVFSEAENFFFSFSPTTIRHSVRRIRNDPHAYSKSGRDACDDDGEYQKYDARRHGRGGRNSVIENLNKQISLFMERNRVDNILVLRYYNNVACGRAGIGRQARLRACVRDVWVQVPSTAPFRNL